MNYGFNDAKEKVEMFSKTEAYNDLGIFSYGPTEQLEPTGHIVQNLFGKNLKIVNHRIVLTAGHMSEIGVTTLAAGQSVIIGILCDETVGKALSGFSNAYFQTLSHLERSVSDDVNISLKAEFVALEGNTKIDYRIQNDGYQDITFSSTPMMIATTILCQNVPGRLL